MRKDLTDITVVLDRSGSMQSIRKDAEGGLNAFIEAQKAQPGEARFSLVQFDHEYELVHSGVPIRDVPRCLLAPRGGTALLDAVGRTINDIGARLAALPEADRPGLVVVVIVTDGQENQSREFTRERVREMIAHQSDVYKWQFTYLGANQDAFAEAHKIGIASVTTANFAPANSRKAFDAAAANVARMRSCSAAGGDVQSHYTSAERASLTEVDGK